MTSKKEIVPIGLIESRIYTVRGQRVMLDSDLAEVYGTTTKRMNEQVKRNEDRFPKEFAFRLSKSEWEVLRSQIAASSGGRGGRRYPPRAFTEHGAIMASNVLNSDRAIRVSVHVVRAFIKQRQMLADREVLTEWLRQLQQTVDKHDELIPKIVEALHALLADPPPKPRKRIGYQAELDDKSRSKRTKRARS